MSVTVSIGRATGEGTELSDEEWHDYVAAAGRLIHHWHPYVYFTGEGIGSSEDWGEEDAWTWVCADLPGYTMYVDYFRDWRELRERFGQEAVAYTFGTTRFL